MANQRNKILSTFTAQLTSTVSVALVLMLLGIIALLGLGGASVTRDLREHVGFNIILAENAGEAQVNVLKQRFTTAPYVASVSYFSPEDALHKWEQDTGEDLMKLLGVNPFSGELEIKVKPDYATTDSLRRVTSGLTALPYIHEVVMHDDLIDAINANVKSLALLLTIIAAALLFISVALINNTVRLSVYARRFIIHTMKLVGARPGFIRRPFVTINIVSGLIAGAIAAAILAGALAYLHDADGNMATALPWETAWPVFALLPVAGILICGLASWFATNKYIRLTYDDMFR